MSGLLWALLIAGGGLPLALLPRYTGAFLPLWLAVGGGVGEVWKTISNAAIATFTAIVSPLRQLVVDIDPVQNLNGYDNPWPAGGGKNKLVDALINGQVGSNGGYSSSTSRITNVDPTLDPANSQTYLAAGKYTLSVAGLDNCTALIKQADGTITDNFALSWNNLPFTFTVSQDGYFLFTARKSNSSSISPSDYKAQVESGESATSWEPYSNICPIYGWNEENVWIKSNYDPSSTPNKTIDFGGTCYGGFLDVIHGSLTVTHDNIASYAGEALTGEWISSMDVYAPGTTPTTGAQVVYELASSQTVQLTAQQVSSLLGANNVWADTGNVTVEYRES